MCCAEKQLFVLGHQMHGMLVVQQLLYLPLPTEACQHFQWLLEANAHSLFHCLLLCGSHRCPPLLKEFCGSVEQFVNL